MMRCHNCKAAISKGHEHAMDARFYHLDCFPRESTATIGVAQIQNHAAEIEALNGRVDELLGEIARLTAEIKKENDNHD